MTKEDREALEDLRRAIDNPLNALKVYAPFKRLRAYYALRGMSSTLDLAHEIWTDRYRISRGIIF